MWLLIIGPIFSCFLLTFAETNYKENFRRSIDAMVPMLVQIKTGDVGPLSHRDVVYNISIHDFTTQKTIVWPSTEEEIGLCLMKGNDKEACHNYIRVLAKNDDSDEVLICGTNAFKPTCRVYTNLQATDHRQKEEFRGNGLSPYDPRHNSTALYIPKLQSIYAGTVADFAGNDPLIYRKTLNKSNDFGIRTERSDIKCLNDPNFVGSFEYNGLVYFWLREQAVEYTNCGKAVYSRVARVCTNDKGGPRAHEDMWTTFLKARLNCSLPGDYPFYFDEIEAISDLVKGNYGSSSVTVVYAVFNTPFAAIRGSAVCAFDMADIEQVFARSAFKSQASPDANWKPVLDSRVPTPRPGGCESESRQMSDEAVSFVKANPLMDAAVPNYFDSPILIHTGLEDRFTQIAVDPAVTAIDGMRYDVLFVGTDRGRVLKVVNLARRQQANRANTEDSSSIVIESLQVFSDRSPIRNLLIYRPVPMNRSDINAKRVDNTAHLVIVSDNEVRRLPLARCQENGASCEECVASRDPYCAWDTGAADCVTQMTGSWQGGRLLQSVSTGRAACPIETQNKLTGPHITQKDQQSPGFPPDAVQFSNPILEAKPVQQKCDCANSAPDFPEGKNTAAIDPKSTNNFKHRRRGKPSPTVEKASNPSNQHTAESMAVAIVCSLVSALLVGFALGYVCSYRDCLKRRKNVTRTPSAVSQQTSAGSFLQSTTKIQRSNSRNSGHINAYESSPKFNGLAPALARPNEDPSADDMVAHVMCLDDAPKIPDDNSANYHMNTLPKDYKVKKMYL